MTDTDAITGTAFPNFMVGDSIMFLTQSGLGNGSIFNNRFVVAEPIDRIPSTTPGAEPPRDARDSGSARSHSTHLETSSPNRP